MLPYKRILMLGGCGMGMAPLAFYLKSAGVEVIIMDDSPNPFVYERLIQEGITFLPQWIEGTVCDLIIYSRAIQQDHDMRKWGYAQGIPQLVRGVFLAELSKNKRLIAVVGSHGKTTTTAFLIQGLKAVLGNQLSYVLGGFWCDTTILPGYYDQASDWLVLEVDESDGTIDHFSPVVTVAVNLDWDHPDYYVDEQALQFTFQQLFLRTQEIVWLPIEMSTVCETLSNIKAHIRFFDKMELLEGVDSVIPIYGFNQKNAWMAFQVIKGLGYNVSIDSLMNSHLLYRRQTCLYQDINVTILADYAHHPTEIEALLSVFKAEKRPIYVVFQPHRYTRTAQYVEAFAKVLNEASGVYLLDVYSAGEAFMAQGTSEAIIPYLTSSIGGVWQLDDPMLSRELHQRLSKPAIMLFIGAGSIYDLACQFTQTYFKAVS